MLYNNNIRVELVKSGNECLQLYYHSIPPRVCSWDVSEIFRTAKVNLNKRAVPVRGSAAANNLVGPYYADPKWRFIL